MELETKITFAAIVALISMVFSGFTSFLIALFNNKKSEEKALRDSLTQINQLNMQYPYLENIKYIEKFSKKRSLNEKDMRYESYCIIVFNYLERLALFCRFNVKRMEKYVHVPELVLPHRYWWKGLLNSKFKQTGYSARFISIVDKIINEDQI
ncbi:hypothetical protein M5D10_07450 [Leptospira santarosai]|uniref:hypothetical protein n=1 Tax=Leptospira TaxID=171 RepID=UPI00055CA1F6|nr:MULTISPECIES: hypothetical protein [Leptospira]UZN08757.1 hypothetical protein M5D10_07450 [Leptospira santarosai]